MQLYYTACGDGEQYIGRFEDEDYAWRPARPGQQVSPSGEWWGIALTPAPDPMGMREEHYVCVTIPDDVVSLYARWWDQDGNPCEAEAGVDHDYLVPAAIVNQYPALALEA
jgi:hypothetical protein